MLIRRFPQILSRLTQILQLRKSARKSAFIFSALAVAGVGIFIYSYFFSKPAVAAWPPARRASGSESLMIFSGFYVYLLKSLKDNKYYIGQTDSIINRLNQHNKGQVRSTKSRTPFTLIGYEKYSTRSESMWREHEIKSHSDKKQAFIKKVTAQTEVKSNYEKI